MGSPSVLDLGKHSTNVSYIPSPSVLAFKNKETFLLLRMTWAWDGGERD